MAPEAASPPDLSVVIPAFNEEGNIARAVEGVLRVCQSLGIRYEVLVVDGRSSDRTAAEAMRAGARVVEQSRPGYGAALQEAFQTASGAYILTMDSDLSHPPNVIRTLFRLRDRADILIASRYVKGGHATMPWLRKVLSLALNRVFARVLDIPVRDLSSGFRLYRRRVVEELEASHSDFSFLQEILVKGYSAGFSIHEVPFHYFPRTRGSSKARLLRFGISYLKLLGKSWRLRNSIQSADYDERAFDSWILPQRWWQRWRYRIITGYTDRARRVLDLGCGSSRIFEALPGGVGVDINLKKLRYRRTLGNDLICATLERLPFPDRSFGQLICSEVIEHVPRDDRIFREFQRVLEPGGILVLGTPDYGRWQWRFVEWVYGKVMPGAYAQEHITRYTRSLLREILAAHGFQWLDHRYVFAGELIVRSQKR